MTKILTILMFFMMISSCHLEKYDAPDNSFHEINDDSVILIPDEIPDLTNQEYIGEYSDKKDIELLNTDVVLSFNGTAPNISAFFGGSIFSYEKTMDSNGVPLVDGKYHPSIIALYVINLYIRNHINYASRLNIDKIATSADWLADNIKDRGDFSEWIFYDIEGYMVETPWSSSLTNGWGVLALIYAAYLIPEKREEYFPIIKKALNYLFVTMENGGGLGYWSDGSIWFEEYPNIESPNHVLNGFVFVLDVLNVFNHLFPETVINKHFKRAFRSLSKQIEHFDGDYGSYYDYYAKGNKIGSNYHNIHWKQIAWAYYKTGDENLRAISKKWYEAEVQTDSIVRASSSIDEEYHGENRLSDAIFWYQYWSSFLPVKIDLVYDKIEKVYGINLFCVKGLEPEKLEIYYKNSSGGFNIILDGEIEILKSGYNKTEENETVVIPIRFNDPVSTSHLSINIVSEEKSIVAIREIGTMRDLSTRYVELFDMLTLKHEWYVSGKFIY